MVIIYPSEYEKCRCQSTIYYIIWMCIPHCYLSVEYIIAGNI